MKLGAPSMVVLLDPARSAEPPQSSGVTSASAVRTLPEAARVAMPLGSAGKVGNASAKWPGSLRLTTRSSRDALSGWEARQAAYPLFHSSWAVLPRPITSRARAMTSASTSKVWAGSKPSSVLVAAIALSPSAEPWDAPVSSLPGVGQAMTVLSTTSVGLSLTVLALSIAASSASTSSTYRLLLLLLQSPLQSTVTTCQP